MDHHSPKKVFNKTSKQNMFSKRIVYPFFKKGGFTKLKTTYEDPTPFIFKFIYFQIVPKRKQDVTFIFFTCIGIDHAKLFFLFFFIICCLLFINETFFFFRYQTRDMLLFYEKNVIMKIATDPFEYIFLIIHFLQL